jgi:hypothetical protein
VPFAASCCPDAALFSACDIGLQRLRAGLPGGAGLAALQATL